MTLVARRAVVLAAASAACACAVWVMAFHVHTAGWADGVVARGFIGLQTSLTKQLATSVTSLAGATALAISCIFVAGASLARRLPVGAAGVLALLLGANVTTQLLKVALAHPRYEPIMGADQVDPASWPSGHATAAMSIALALVIVSPRGRRPLVGALGGVFAAAMAYAILLLDWHYPSDVVGGYLVALTWASLIVGVSGRAAADPDREVGRPPRPSRRPTLTTGIALGCVAAGVGIVGGRRAFDSGDAHVTMVLGTLAIALAGLAVAAAFARFPRP